MIENPDFENIRLISVKEFDSFTTHYSGNASKFKLYTFEEPYHFSFIFILLYVFLVLSLFKNPINWPNTSFMAFLIILHSIYINWKSFSTDLKIDTINLKIQVVSKFWFVKYFYKKTKIDFSKVNKIDSREIKKGKVKLRRIQIHTNKRNRIFIDLHESQDYNLFITSLENIIIKQKHKPNIIYQTN